MARILYTGIVSDIKGSIGGTTFQHNASGRIVKRRSDQKFALSSEQSSSAVKLASIVTRWRGLSVANRDLWNAMALAYPRYDKWGRLKTLSGFQYFTAANRNLLTLGAALIDSPAAYSAPLEVNDYDPVATNATLSLDFSVPQNYSRYNLVIMASPPTQALSSKSRQLRKIIGISDQVNPVSLDVLNPYVAVYPVVWADLIDFSHGIIQFSLFTIDEVTGITSMFNSFPLEF